MVELRAQIRANRGLVVLALVLVVGVGIGWWFTSQPYSGPTGGLGQFEKNSLVLSGWETAVTSEQVELGEVVSSKQQQAVLERIATDLVRRHGDSDYREARIEPQVDSRYEAAQAIDQTIFYVGVESTGERYKVILDHNLDQVRIFKGKQELP